MQLQTHRTSCWATTHRCRMQLVHAVLIDLLTSMGHMDCTDLRLAIEKARARRAKWLSRKARWDTMKVMLSLQPQLLETAESQSSVNGQCSILS